MSRKFLTPILLPADPAVPLEAATKQYVDSKAGGTDTAGKMVDYRVLPASLNLGAGVQFISGLYVILPTPNRRYLVSIWLTIGAPTPGTDASFDLSCQMSGAPGAENPTAAAVVRGGQYTTTMAEWPVWPTPVGLPTPNQVNGWINCVPIIIYRGIMRAIDVGPTT